MSDLPLDETALQAASQTAPFVGREVSERLISTYMAAAGFERVVEEAYRQECVKTPWVPVVQAESEEK